MTCRRQTVRIWLSMAVIVFTAFFFAAFLPGTVLAVRADAAQTASKGEEVLYSSGKNKLVRRKGKIYYYAKGKLKKKTWKKIKGDTYYFTEKGSAAVGRVLIDGKYYYFTRDGILFKEGWKTGKNGRTRYYSKKDGHMFTGIRTIDGKKYGFDKNGILVKSGRLSYAWFNKNGILRPRKGRSIADLKKRVRQCINSFPGTWSVYIKNETTGQSLIVNNRQMYAASLIKLFAMGAAYQKVADGKLGSGAVSGLIPTMIADSNNAAFNSVVRTIGPYTVNNWCRANGYTQTSQVHGLSPAGNNYGIRTSGGSNVTSVRDCGKFLDAVYRGTCVNRDYSKKMVSALKLITRDKSLYYRSKLPSGIPGSAVVANKTGDLTDYAHDCAIVYSKNADYIICVMAHVPGRGYSCSGYYRRLSSLVYNFFN